MIRFAIEPSRRGDTADWNWLHPYYSHTTFNIAFAYHFRRSFSQAAGELYCSWDAPEQKVSGRHGISIAPESLAQEANRRRCEQDVSEGRMYMKSKKVVLSSLMFSGALAMYAGSAWSQGKSSGSAGSSSSQPSSDIKDPQTLPPGDPAARQPGAGNPEPGQTPTGGKSKTDPTATSPGKMKNEPSGLETTPGKMKGDSIEQDTKPGKSSSKSGKDPQTLSPGNPAAREPGAGNPEPGQSRGGEK